MSFLNRFYNLTFSSEKDFAHALKELLGFTPNKLSIYRLAFRHSSINQEPTANNERLEYLGDAILGAIVADYLFQKFPTKKEGFLTQMRSKMVNRKTLGALGKELGINTVLEYNESEKFLKQNRTIVGNALEALIGAIYLDYGFTYTKDFVITEIFIPNMDMTELVKLDISYKNTLLEWIDKNKHSCSFKMVFEQEISNKKHFTIELCVNGDKVCNGEGFSKKAAEQQAAKRAIDILEVKKAADVEA